MRPDEPYDAELLTDKLKALEGAQADRFAASVEYKRNRLPPRTTNEKAARAKARKVRKRQKLARRRNRR